MIITKIRKTIIKEKYENIILLTFSFDNKFPPKLN